MATVVVATTMEQSIRPQRNDTYVAICPDEFVSILDANEEYILHSTVHKSSIEHKTILVLTSKALYKLSLSGQDRVLWKRDIGDILMIGMYYDNVCMLLMV